jgi:Cyclin
LTALYIASKIEEIYPWKIADFAMAADNGYSVAIIRQTEKFMLKNLN